MAAGSSGPSHRRQSQDQATPRPQNPDQPTPRPQNPDQATPPAAECSVGNRGIADKQARDAASVDDGARGRAARRASAGGAGTGRAQLVLAILLIALVVAGVRAGPGLHWTSTWQGPLHDHGTEVGIGLELVLGALLVALWVRTRRAPDAGWPAERLRRVLAPLIALSMFTLGLALVHAHLSLPPPTRRPKPPPTRSRLGSSPSVASRPAKVPTGGLVAVEYVLLALVVLAVIAAFVILSRRRRLQSAVSEELIPEDDDAAALETAVRAGRLALGKLTEARAAIIACYLAMEHSLGEAGAARGIAETPDELLTRATTADLLHGDAPAVLTDLFYQARFSTGALPDGARQTALRALDAISADLQAATASRPQAGSAAP